MGPAPTDEGPLARQSRELSTGLVDALVERLGKEAEARDGRLLIGDIVGLKSELSIVAENLRIGFLEAFEEYEKAQERSKWDQTRQFPFDRIIVKKFAHLFADFELAPDKSEAVSRRVLPGFFIAMNMMLGPEMLDDLQQRCREIVERVRDQYMDDFDWSHVYDMPEVKMLLLNALGKMALYFRDVERRTVWFIDLVNANLPPANNDAPDKGWLLTEAGMRRLFAALFLDLKRALDDEMGRLRITRFHGAEACVDLVEIFEKLQTWR